MLQSLTNYLLGGTTTTNSNAGRAGGIDSEDNSADRVALRTTDHDDGWTMVDRDSEGNSDGDSSEEEEIDDTVNDDGLQRVRLRRADSADSILYVHVQDMEESWFVTPPPCFSSQTGPIQLVTSPLENLLIEHPSMSVYQGPQYVPGAPNESPLELEEFIDIMEQEFESAGDVAHGRRNYLPLPLTKLQKAKTRSAQKVQLKKSAQQATRGYTNRSNKAREVNGRNWNSRRKERCQGSNRSHANNNRKC